MPSVCFYFQVHQPFRLRHYNFFEIGESPYYEDIDANRTIMARVAKKCYLPMNELLTKLLLKLKGKFKVAFSITGTALEQFEAYAPEVLESFQKLVKTGFVELLAETDNHSLAFLYSTEEFESQVRAHDEKIMKYFGLKTKVFRNTELIYSNDLARAIAAMGYKGALLEGADHILGWRSPNFVYTPAEADCKLLLRNYSLSDDIAFRFSNKAWGEYPLTAKKYAEWLAAAKGDVINLFMDYETFGEHQAADSGIFEFMSELPEEVLKKKGFSFATPSDIFKDEKGHPAVAQLNVTNPMSWADEERDLTAWMGNDMQKDALETIYRLAQKVKETDSADLYKVWGRLQASDHFYYMCTKWFADGEVHKYFNPYGTPYDAYINYMNVMGDLGIRVHAELTGEEPSFALHGSNGLTNIGASALAAIAKPKQKSADSKAKTAKVEDAYMEEDVEKAKTKSVAKTATAKTGTAKKTVVAKKEPVKKAAAPAKAKASAKTAKPVTKAAATKPAAKAPVKKAAAVKPAAVKKTAAVKKPAATKAPAKKTAVKPAPQKTTKK